MDDGGKQPHTFGGGQQRHHHHHPRPFFYVQPPSQPYFLYQHWQMNNPYTHYGLPPGFNFTRPCMPPLQYLQYPGFFLPHAPLYPVDYRRVFEPRFHAPHPWTDAPRPQQHVQPPGRPETACSEAQTDPSDAISKLIECLDQIRATELQAGRELDSGVASQSSGMFSPAEEKKEGEEGLLLPAGSPAVTLCDSTAAVYDGESSQRSLSALSPHGCWSAGLEEPLDSSSVHELEQAADVHTDVLTDPCAQECDPEKFYQQKEDSALPCDKTSKADPKGADPSFQILRLPFDSVLASGEASAGPYYYNYLSMHSTHERMSVLSPSLDELSSRDEMFSTDLDDADLFPKHVYAGRRFTKVLTGSPQPEDAEDVWLQGAKRSMCACCGKSLAKGRSRAHGAKVYRDEGGDSEEDGRYGTGSEPPVRVFVRKHAAPRRTHPLPQRQAAKSWYKRGRYQEPPGETNPEEGHVCAQEAAGDAGGEVAAAAEGQCRTCQDRLCRGDLSTMELGRRGEADAVPRRRQTNLLQRQDVSAQRKVMYHRPRDEDNDDDELPPWERGSTIGGEPRS